MDFKTLITRSSGEGGSTDSEWYRKRDEDPKLQKKKDNVRCTAPNSHSMSRL